MVTSCPVGERDLECSICRQDYNWAGRCPRELECLHAFCTECLVHLEGQQLWGPRRISCPLCRHDTELGASGVLGLPHQEHALAGLSAAALGQRVILSLDSGETTMVTLPTVSLRVERGGGLGSPAVPGFSLSQRGQGWRGLVCLAHAAARLSVIFILACVLAFILGPRLL
ncbi:RING finger protein 223-like [Narcine bancroftii]|uniref:RING finger protein 223-like n=1 Tax=Narcine bancroftii TaxID=1343680 RepID=UPI00383218B4